jgi:hypothetical protein
MPLEPPRLREAIITGPVTPILSSRNAPVLPELQARVEDFKGLDGHVSA